MDHHKFFSLKHPKCDVIIHKCHNTKMGLLSHQNIIHGSTKMNHYQVSKPMVEEEGVSDHGNTPWL